MKLFLRIKGPLPSKTNNDRGPYKYEDGPNHKPETEARLKKQIGEKDHEKRIRYFDNRGC